MKVLHTLDSLNRGGTETLTLDVCRNARRKGLDLTFVATGGGALESDFETSPVNYHRLDRRHPIDLGVVLELRKIIRTSGARIVHAHQPVEALHLFLASLAIPGVKCVLSHHGGSELFNRQKNRISSKILTKIVGANVSCSKSLLADLESGIGLNTKRNFHVVHNGVDPERLITKTSALKNELGLDEETKIIGMVGNFMPPGMKDQMTVLKSYPGVLTKFKNTHLVFAGGVTGGGESYLEECNAICSELGISEHVTFLGSRSDVPNILNSLDLFAFSSLREGMPIALIEALLVGVPVVVTDIVANLEVTKEGAVAGVFKAGDSTDLTQKLVELLENENMRECLANKGRSHALANFSIDAHLHSLNLLYENLLSN